MFVLLYEVADIYLGLHARTFSDIKLLEQFYYCQQVDGLVEFLKEHKSMTVIYMQEGKKKKLISYIEYDKS